MPSALRSLLVVGSDPDVIRALAPRVRSLRIDGAVTLAEAVERAEGNDYGVILIDFSSSRSERVALLERLQSLRSTRRPVVLILSDGGDPLEGTDWRAVHGVVRKPFDADELAGLIESCIDLQHGRELEMMMALLLAGAPLFSLLQR